MFQACCIFILNYSRLMGLMENNRKTLLTEDFLLFFPAFLGLTRRPPLAFLLYCFMNKLIKEFPTNITVFGPIRRPPMGRDKLQEYLWLALYLKGQ